ncbi:MAG: alpha-amylase family glycosyl hydrolase, partial [bacterium]
MNPSLYQINIRTFLSNLGRQATLDDIPDLFLDRLAQQGFDWLWPLGIWSIGTASRSVSRSERGWRDEYLKTLPDLCDADIGGSPFAITPYCTDPALGGDEALARLRVRLADRGIKLLVDFVPNHVALDHPW